MDLAAAAAPLDSDSFGMAFTSYCGNASSRHATNVKAA